MTTGARPVEAATCPTITTRLSNGVSHSQVIALKKYLVQEGVMGPNEYSTYFGPLTEAALKKWQAKKGIVSSGTPASTGYGATGPLTRAALAACNSVVSANTNTSSLGIGSRGEAVFALQRQLILARLLSADSLTGYYGPLTKAAHQQYLTLGSGSGATASNNTGTNNSALTSYSWISGVWSACTNGSSSRIVSCAASNGGLVADSYCMTSAKPSSVQSCTSTTSTENTSNAPCAFNGQTVAHGASVTAYQSTSIPSGQTCASIAQNRTCTNGTLSGSYTNTSCSVQAAAFSYNAPNNSIDLRTYFPSNTQLVTLRKANSDAYASYTFGPGNSSMQSLYTSLLNLNKPGSVYTWVKKYGSCTPTIATLFFGDDLSVTEVGDWYAVDGCTPDVAFGYSDQSMSVPDGLAWASPGGLRTPASGGGNPATPSKIGLGIQRQVTPGSAYTNYGPYGALAWNESFVKETLPTFTPAYGRGADGSWGAGKGKTYSNVIRVIFYHGTHQAGQNDIACASSLKNSNAKYAGLYRTQSGYHTYASEYYLAPGTGIIQEGFLYTENGSYWSRGNCEMGLLFETNQDDTNSWISYIDE